MIRKVLIMNKELQSKKETCGLLSLELNNSLVGKLRVFNLNEYDSFVLSLKIGENKLVFNNINNVENFEFNTIYHNINAPICAVLANIKDGKVNICAVGHSENDNVEPESLFDDFSDDEKLAELQEMIDKEIERQNVFDLEENVKVSSNNTNNKEEKIENADVNGSFLNLIKVQLDELFSTFPHYKQLEDMLYGTEWVQISGEDNYYVLGKIFEDGFVTHICYGIPSEKREKLPPAHLRKFCQWLQLNKENPQADGFWVMYQDAQTGENVVMDDYF